MLPSFTNHDHADEMTVDAVLGAQVFDSLSSEASATNIRGGLSRQFCAEARTLATTVPIFADHVRCVLGRSAEKKVSRVHAGRLIAAMTYEHASRYFSMRNLIGETMSTLVSEASVSLLRSGSVPSPTSVLAADIDLRPEPCDDVFIHGTHPPVGHGLGDCTRARPFSLFSRKAG